MWYNLWLLGSCFFRHETLPVMSKDCQLQEIRSPSVINKYCTLTFSARIRTTKGQSQLAIDKSQWNARWGGLRSLVGTKETRGWWWCAWLLPLGSVWSSPAKRRYIIPCSSVEIWCLPWTAQHVLWCFKTWFILLGKGYCCLFSAIVAPSKQ